MSSTNPIGTGTGTTYTGPTTGTTGRTTGTNNIGASGPTTGTSNVGTGTSKVGGTGGQLNQVTSGLKEVFAKVHGAGESVRGEFNSAVDGAFHENEGVAKNSSVATAGRNEMETGQFARGTRQREGVEPTFGGGVGGRGERST